MAFIVHTNQQKHGKNEVLLQLSQSDYCNKMMILKIFLKLITLLFKVS